MLSFSLDSKIKVTVLATLLAASLHCKNTDVRFDLQDSKLVAQVAEEKISAMVFQKLWGVIKSNRLYRQFGSNPKEALFATIDNMLLAREYEKVNHTHGANAEVRVNKVYLQTVDFFLQNENLKTKYEAVMKQTVVPNGPEIAALFAAGDAENPGPQIKKVPAKNYTIVKASPLVKRGSFYDFYESLNNNEKLSLLGKGNSDYLKFLYKRFAREHFLQTYIEKDVKNQPLYKEIKQIVQAGVLAGYYRNELGIAKAHAHSDEVSSIEKRAEQVSMARVKEYYQNNLDRFSEISGVDCRHITVKSEQVALKLTSKAEKLDSAGFKALVKKNSLHPDRNSSEPGLIVGVKNGPELHKKPRIHSLCLMTPLGKVAMFPNENRFEVIRLEKKEMGHKPLNNDSTIVRDIQRQLAIKDVKREFEQKKKELYRGVKIRINPQQLARIR